MIVQENLGNGFIRTYSDAGFYIHGGFPEGDYDEAVDPEEYGRTYVETDIPIVDEDGDGEPDGQEATIEDYQNALEGLGVSLDG